MHAADLSARRLEGLALVSLAHCFPNDEGEREEARPEGENRDDDGDDYSVGHSASCNAAFTCVSRMASIAGTLRPMKNVGGIPSRPILRAMRKAILWGASAREASPRSPFGGFRPSEVNMLATAF